MTELADGQNDNAPGNDENGGVDVLANQEVVPVATPSSSSSSAARQAQLAQLKELQAKLDEQRRQTQELRTALEQQRTARGARAQVAGRAARKRILANDNVDKPPELKTAGEKLVAAAYLLQAMPEPSTTSGRNLRREAQVLIEQAVVQQAESSTSRMRSTVPKPGGTTHQGHEASVHTPPGGKGKAVAADGAKAPSVHDRIGKTPARERLHDTRGHAGDGDARNIINGRKYTPRRGGRFDPEHDRGESPEPPGTRVFSREIRTAPFPPRFRQPATLVKYSGETDPAVWLNDYRLACQLGGATDDVVIIRNLPLPLTDATRM